MGAVWLQARSELQARRGGILVLILLVGLEAGVVMPAALLAIPLTLMIASLVAAVPGKIASRMLPAAALRTE